MCRNIIMTYYNWNKVQNDEKQMQRNANVSKYRDDKMQMIQNTIVSIKVAIELTSKY